MDSNITLTVSIGSDIIGAMEFDSVAKAIFRAERMTDDNAAAGTIAVVRWTETAVVCGMKYTTERERMFSR